MADIFDEVDEELRQERAAKLWKKYGVYVIAAAVAVVVAVGGHRFWREHQASQRIAASERYEAALDRIAEAPDAAMTDLAAIAEDGTGGYATLAAFREAGLAIEQGDRARGVTLYQELARGNTPAPFKTLAGYLSVLHRVRHDAPNELLAAIAPIADGAGPWRALALEVRAVLQLEAGDVAAARATLEVIADDAETPQRLRTRATEMLRAIPE